MVDRTRVSPCQFEIHGEDDLWPEPSKGHCDVPAESDPVLDGAVGVPEELDVGHADGRRTPALFVLSDDSATFWRHPVDAGLTARDEHVGHLLAESGETSHRARHPVLQVIWVGDDRHGAVPVFRQGHRCHGLPPSVSVTLGRYAGRRPIGAPDPMDSMDSVQPNRLISARDCRPQRPVESSSTSSPAKTGG